MKILSYLLPAIILFQVASRIPSLLRQTQLEGTTVVSIPIRFLDGSITKLESLPGRHILVFWATWCGPCTVELSRINKMVREQKLPKESVIAISSFEDEALVKATAQERAYQFRVAVDEHGTIANHFDVTSTPTVVFLDEAQNIQWITSGLSPTLEFRALHFLKNN